MVATTTARDFFDPLQSIIEAAKGERVEVVQDHTKMKRDHMSSVGRMVLETSARDPEPFLTTNQMFARIAAGGDPRGKLVPPSAYRSASFDIITGDRRPPSYKMDPALSAKLARVDPLAHSSPWDHPLKLELPRAQQSADIFLRSHSAFLRREENPAAAVEWRSASKLVDSNRRHERSQLSLAEKYTRSVTASAELGWGLEVDYKTGRVPSRDFHFGRHASHITKFQQSMLLGPMNVANPARPSHTSHAGIIG
ncbi:hypothetical protein T492DRAFT_944044 [Pavlovales sp. CCMP2436]|nr:hypothetical protein T492DRAFT_944044 [Pavlovales sp. CCMP2436]